MFGKLLLIAAVAWPAFAQASSTSSGGCDPVISPLTNRTVGTDYAGPNISVVPVHSESECCQACIEHPDCAVAVWHNLDHQLCALKETLGNPFIGHRVATCKPKPRPAAFRFSGAHSNHMVLQGAPLQASVWGFTTAGDEVTVTFGDATITATTKTTNGSFIWTAALPRTQPSFDSYTIVAHSKHANKTISLTDVLFGDVWVCSGQSNMAYSLNGSNGNAIVHPPVNNSEAEFADMHNYPYVRLLRAGKQRGATTMLEPHPNDPGGSTEAIQGWTPPCTAEGVCRVDFSSVCYFYGRNVFSALQQAGKKRPIGLIGTYWGGTADELWSSPDALHKCLDPAKPVPPTDSDLYYGMLSPFLRSTITGVIWYQGEADAQHPGGRYDGYNCTFPAMIEDWRAKWSQFTDGRTNATFPFGFVQLNSIGNGAVYTHPSDPNDDLSPAFGYAGLRWSQTASYGYVPNRAMPGVFMAVSLDTPDRPSSEPEPHSSGFNVHSPFKQPTAARLARAGLAVAYGMDVGTWSPYPSRLVKLAGGKVEFSIENLGAASAVTLKSRAGFEALSAGHWVSVEISAHTANTVTIEGVPAGASRMRYNWYSNPCGIHCFGCAVYVSVQPLGRLSGEENFLPLPPFVMDISEA